MIKICTTITFINLTVLTNALAVYSTCDEERTQNKQRLFDKERTYDEDMVHSEDRAYDELRICNGERTDTKDKTHN